MSGKILLLIGLGGFLGSIARYCITVYFTRLFPSVFPFGTFAVNILGCFAIGVFFGLSSRFEWFSPEWRLFLITGFCGGIVHPGIQFALIYFIPFFHFPIPKVHLHQTDILLWQKTEMYSKTLTEFCASGEWTSKYLIDIKGSFSRISVHSRSKLVAS
ncbi:MAG TPA: CrcB family protein [Cyclobacteriaceae bacterium]|nr:CrcB family protein [Cyclobacteriaceae bacterium]